VKSPSNSLRTATSSPRMRGNPGSAPGRRRAHLQHRPGHGSAPSRPLKLLALSEALIPAATPNVVLLLAGISLSIRVRDVSHMPTKPPLSYEGRGAVGAWV
jgi:hypothetical protein